MAVVLFSQLIILNRAATVQTTNSVPDEPVNSYSTLSAVIGRAPTGGTPYTIAITEDIIFTGVITITNGKNVVIESDANSPCKLIETVGAKVTLLVDVIF